MSLLNIALSAYDILMQEYRTRACSNCPEDNEPNPINTNPLPSAISSKVGVLTMSPQGLVELANYEGLANTKYIDSGGVHTIGIGMTVSEIPDLAKWSWDKYLDNETCVKMFKSSLKKYEEAIRKVLRVKITQNEFDALVSITYNIGTGNTRTMQGGMAGSTFMKRLNSNDLPKNVVAAMQFWNKDNGKVVKGLVNRRKAEGQVFLTGQYQNDGTVALISVDPKTHKPRYNKRTNILQYI